MQQSASEDKTVSTLLLSCGKARPYKPHDATPESLNGRGPFHKRHAHPLITHCTIVTNPCWASLAAIL
ncbi:hypothetical protein BN2476_850025 [Paraburkholderia piptadeniae]|uniref:Uncharacterized protein n=1 Tax=Paraburkholderia piptadeniae TaxID=1701573 RepID=A0A1N7STB3_9BURK|nr:hypothetical protein BN2476_850025 [Paraburkholderia piptadeniae]